MLVADQEDRHVSECTFEKKLGIEGKEERFNVGYFFLQESKLGHRINKDS